jgi:hypothetical protein
MYKRMLYGLCIHCSIPSYFSVMVRISGLLLWSMDVGATVVIVNNGDRHYMRSEGTDDNGALL